MSPISAHHWFDLGAARCDFGYAPQVSLAEGMARLRAAFCTAAPPP